MLTFTLHHDDKNNVTRVMAANSTGNGSWNDGRRFVHFHAFSETRDGRRAVCEFHTKVMLSSPDICRIETSPYWDEIDPVAFSPAWQMRYQPEASC